MGPRGVMMIATGLRVAARRPAAWLAFAASLACSSLLAWPGNAATLPVALVCGGLVAVAAVGDRPRGGRGLPLPEQVWLCRTVWPLAGAALAAATAATGAVAAAVAAMTPLVAAATILVPPWPGVPIEVAGAGGRTPLFAAPLTRLAMATTLVAMAVCYFLDPSLGGWYSIVVAGWFAWLAPAAATADGGATDEAARRMLLRTAAEAGGVALPGSLAHALRGLASIAALLAWPAVVAALLWSGRGGRIDGPVTAVAVLGSLAGGAAGVLSVAWWLGVRAETARAMLACTLALACAAVLPRLPTSPSLWQGAAGRAAAGCGAGVERFVGSCETAHVTQPAPSAGLLPARMFGPAVGVENRRAAAR